MIIAFEEACRDTTPPAASRPPEPEPEPEAAGPRLLVGGQASSGTQPVVAKAIPETTGVTAVASAIPVTAAVSPATAYQPPTGKRPGISPAVLWTCGSLLVAIIVLGVAMAMRGDPADEVSPPDPETAAKDEDPGTPDDPEKPAPKPPPPKPDPKPTPPKKPSLTEQFRNKDKDKDFKLSFNEFNWAKKDPKKAKELQARFKKLDKDQDGFLTIKEFKGEQARSGS